MVFDAAAVVFFAVVVFRAVVVFFVAAVDFVAAVEAARGERRLGLGSGVVVVITP